MPVDHPSDHPANHPSPIRQRINQITHFINAVRHIFSNGYETVNSMTDNLPRYLARAWQNFNQRDTQRAAALVYYAVFSIFPLIVLAVALVSGLIGPALAQQQILQKESA